MENTNFKPYVYKVTNRITGQFYYGMKSTPGEIGIDYFTSSSNLGFKNDFKQHPENYLCEKVFIGDIDDVVSKETELIKENINNPLILNRAYNNGHLYISSNEDIRKVVYQKIAEANKRRAIERPETYPGKKNNICSEATKRKISNTLKGREPPNKGKPASEEQKIKQSNSMKGKEPWNKGKTSIYSEETLRNMREHKKGIEPPNKGKKASDETRKKLSESHIGQTPWNKGKQATEEAKKHQSEAHKGQKAHNVGKKCFNNGVRNVYAYECPDGFVPGKVKKHKQPIYDNNLCLDIEESKD